MCSIGVGVTFKQGTKDEAKKPWAPQEYKGAKESLYWLDGGNYRRLDGDSWAKIERGAAKL